MKRFLYLSALACLVGSAGMASAAPPPAAVGDIDVMTQNQYIGGDVLPIIGAISADPAVFNAAVVHVIETVAANRTAARVAAMAGEIAARKPHLVGLQEVWDVECIPAMPELNGYPCTDPALAAAWGDHLALTQQALGSAYYVAAVVENFKVNSFGPYPGIPFTYNGVPAFVTVLDRDVILARSDVTATPFTAYPCNHPSVDGCNYDVDIPLPELGTSVKRSFVMVDATVNGHAYRFVNTHLETEQSANIPGFIQSAEAAQLAGTVLAVTPPGMRLIVVGDTNSDPSDPSPFNPYTKDYVPTPYWIFADAGFNDAWLGRPGNVAGLSCCQLEDLSNRVSVLGRRVDLILTREMPRKVKDARLIGEVAADRLMPHGRGLWPSDHASVAAKLGY